MREDKEKCGRVKKCGEVWKNVWSESKGCGESVLECGKVRGEGGEVWGVWGEVKGDVGVGRSVGINVVKCMG